MKALPKTHPIVLTLLASTFFVVAYNFSFWRTFIDATGGLSLHNLPLHLATFIVLVLFLNAFLTLVSFRQIIKPVLIVLFCSTALATYFMTQYGVAIDATMIQNVFETNTMETFELLSWRMVLFVSLLGVLPSYLVWRTKLSKLTIGRDLLIRFGSVFLSIIVVVGLLLVFYKSYAPTFREHRELRLLFTPLNYIQATKKFFKQKFKQPLVVAPLGMDAEKGTLWKGENRKTVTVIVLGETARSMNFSLNGYERNTNPELSKQNGLINFTNVQSCGTATGVSVPCVFSSLTHDNYSDEKAKGQEGLLDVFSHAGFDVLWRNNNTGCKGACDRVEYEDFSQPVPDSLCTSDECYDERMLQGLSERIRSSKKDMVIVLHQKGSHGPAYWKRYPERFKKYGPVCETSDFRQCTTKSIVNAYDNTILYTDHFVSSVIDTLRQLNDKDRIDTSLIYFSDHGESLGEDGMFLHGAPYMISPDEQRHVPFMLWLSDSFRERFQLNTACLNARRKQPFSHDNIFHSVLGMLNVSTAVHDPALDIFQACSQGSTIKSQRAAVGI